MCADLHLRYGSEEARHLGDVKQELERKWGLWREQQRLYLDHEEREGDLTRFAAVLWMPIEGRGHRGRRRGAATEQHTEEARNLATLRL